MIELIDAEGNREFVRQHGRLGVTKHTKILSALEKRALRYRRKGQKEVDQDEILYNEALDETGTVSTACLTDSDDESWGDEPSRVPITAAEATFLEKEAVSGISDDLLNVHGIAPGPKPEGVTRLIY